MVDGLNGRLYPYVVFLPLEHKRKILGSIFGSRAAVDILLFFLREGSSNKIYQRDLVRELPYSNKTVIKNLKSLTSLGVLREQMEKLENRKRTVWVKTHYLSDIGEWFSLLLAEETELPQKKKIEILQNIFRLYVRWARGLCEDLDVSKKVLERIFDEEMRQGNGDVS